MKLTREEALKLHRQMWTDMQKVFGDTPDLIERFEYKNEWCKKHFPKEQIEAHCFLCEYTKQYGEYCCDHCPIKWDEDDDYDCCTGLGVNYEHSPISVILALPEREVEDEVSDN